MGLRQKLYQLRREFYAALAVYAKQRGHASIKFAALGNVADKIFGFRRLRLDCKAEQNLSASYVQLCEELSALSERFTPFAYARFDSRKGKQSVFYCGVASFYVVVRQNQPCAECFYKIFLFVR